jgi:hypothetical protein
MTSISARRSLWSRLPIIHHLQQSVGWQRGMLVAGLVIIGVFLLTAAFAPWLAPYGFSQLRDETGTFGAQLPPNSQHLLGTTVGGYDVLSRVIWGSQTAVLVIVIAVTLSIFAGVLLGPEEAVRAAELVEPVGGEQGREDRDDHEDAGDHEARDEHPALQADALPQLLDDRQAVPPRRPHVHGGNGCRVAHQYLTRGSRIAATMSTMKLVSATMTASRATMPCTATKSRLAR